MKGAALGFSFFTLILVIMVALVSMSTVVGVYTDLFPTVSLFAILPFSVLLISFNASIVYGLRLQKLWAFVLGSIEILIVMFMLLVGIYLEGTSALMTSVFFISIFASLLSTLWKDYREFKDSEVM